ncbi:MAG: bifunctional [glutamine synthetase] adenylyltransferase/[glutamine synthetase]-adenylyl-L-tyrosine phosphorylase [Alphaproteobacteria bacterium]|nr:bifunctional [glutamine synthetase] adenylyltransferase/[glutamine synthetase]-adenylyl-L-tyrosine phosphorylase [Alphaproteobacteria bacterium]
MLKPVAISSKPAAAIEAAAAEAPYLADLAHSVDGYDDPDALLGSAFSLCEHVASGDVDPAMTLRLAKKQAHLAIAAGDLCGRYSLAQTTRQITEFADASMDAALTASLGSRDLSARGLFAVALGKMGAFELNYSSDIDIAVFVDPDLFDGGEREPVDAAIRTVRKMIGLLDDRTPDGYVFRTDLRLRPDPSSTPVAVSTRRAELYYESVGQNWERMVWIKGRAAAGDLEAGSAFISALEPFVWRRHLDYWAIADVQAIKNMINAKAGAHSLDDVAPDVKLGPGGIREIEFFVQTQQIILGGRNPSLRVRGTLEGLQRLVDLGAVEVGAAAELTMAYNALRIVEHRVQMLDDAQTHTLPSFEARRAAVATLCGYSSLDAFDRHLVDTRKCVHAHYRALFADEAQKSQSAVDGNLVFTGVDNDPDTVRTLKELGFTAPETVIEAIRQWHRGRTPATRTTRGRELLTAILPDLLAAMGKTGEPDEAFRRFSRFFEGLRSGVQVLSMLVAETALMDDLVTTLAIAPRIADILARRPGLLEALLFVSDRKETPSIDADTEFETGMELVRRWQGERAFLIGHQLLHGQIQARDAAAAWTELADTCIDLMSRLAEFETIRRFGPPPGAWSVIGLGKLGGREMTAGSDLDILVIYDPDDTVDAQKWFTRFTQRLITALSAETGEGRLYEVDMRLRPSGRAGPVATSIASFERYHMEEAWTWEHMALTRLRALAGDRELGNRIAVIAERAIQTGDEAKRTQDILDMRGRLHREKPSGGQWDLKMRPGGLLDLEFITQYAILTAQTPQSLMPELSRTHQQLAETGEWDAQTYTAMSEAFTVLQALQQVQRIAHVGAVTEADLSSGLKDRLCRAIGSPDFADLSNQLEETCDRVTALFQEKLGSIATD